MKDPISPLSDASNANRIESSPPVSALTDPPTILCVDDEPSMREMICLALTKAGYRVHAATDGMEAWEALMRGSYSLLITDDSMPRMTGYQLIVYARLHSMTLPMMVVSSDLEGFRDPENDWLQIAQLLQKPFDIRSLIDGVRSLLQRGNQPIA